jgi:cyclase
MLRSRIIPCLLVHNKGLVKTIKFKESKYVGDPINTVKIFNEKEVDELMILDIDASVEKREPDFEMIKNLANESRMPLCYGGGVKTVKQARKILSLGVEKVAISSAAIEDISIIKKIAKAIGLQSVVVILDVKKKKIFGGYELLIYNGKKKVKKDPVAFAQELEKEGIGELIINSIDDDGMLKGYNFQLFDVFRDEVSIPMSILGGANSLDNLNQAIQRYKTIGVAAGSLFVFKGKYKAVLINYPEWKIKKQLFNLK